MKLKQILILSGLTLFTFSCGQETESSEPVSNCSLSASETEDEKIHYLYDSDGRITEMIPDQLIDTAWQMDSTGRTQFVYGNNTITILNSEGEATDIIYLNQYHYFDSIASLSAPTAKIRCTMNSQGKPASIEMYEGNSGNAHTRLTFTWAGNNIVKERVDVNSGTEPYFWELDYTYLNEKNHQRNTLINPHAHNVFSPFIYPMSENLISTEAYHSSLGDSYYKTYSYEKDASGKIVKNSCVDNNGSRNEINYFWNCQ